MNDCTIEDMRRIAENDDALEAFVAQCSDTNDIKRLGAMIDICAAGPKHERMADVLLRKDDVAMVKAFVHSSMVTSWVLDNMTTALSLTPQVFAHWARPTPDCLRGLSVYFNNVLDATEKEGLLLGTMPWHGARWLRSCLVEDPARWEWLGVSWVGPKGSTHREAALACGWEPWMLTKQMKGKHMAHAQQWTSLVDYPYSLGALLHLIGEQEGNIPFNSGWDGTVALSGKNDQEPRTFSTEASLDDIMLCQTIVQLHKRSLNFRLSHPQQAGMDESKMQAMRGILDMHVSLGMLDSLASALAHDTIPGMAPNRTMLDAIALPALEG